MGRRRAFDLGTALDVATDLFWRRGYENTSIGELTEAMKIAPPSFYLAFKSKEDLFRRVVAAHQERQGKIIEDAFAQADSKAVVASLLFGFVDDFTSPVRAQGCLIMNNALPSESDGSFRAEWADWRGAFKARLAKRFRQDRSQGKLSDEAQPAALAQIVCAILWGLAVEAASGVARKELRAGVAQFMAGWPR